MGTGAPLRIDLLDDQIDSLRRFDPDTQRSHEAIESLRLLPAREMPLDAEAVREFRRRFRLRFSGDVARLGVYRGVSEGLAPPGIEFYLPLFFERTATLFDYLPRRSGVRAPTRAWQRALRRPGVPSRARHEQIGHDLERPLLAPEEVSMPRSPSCESGLARHARVELERFGADGAAASERRARRACRRAISQLDARASEPLAPLLEFLRATRAACCWRPIPPAGAK